MNTSTQMEAQAQVEVFINDKTMFLREFYGTKLMKAVKHYKDICYFMSSLRTAKPLKKGQTLAMKLEISGEIGDISEDKLGHKDEEGNEVDLTQIKSITFCKDEDGILVSSVEFNDNQESRGLIFNEFFDKFEKMMADEEENNEGIYD